MDKRGRSVERPSRKVRPKLACARCQKRKIKCDGQFPKCGNCSTAGVDCSAGDSARLGPVRDLHQAQIARLQQRVQDLESIIKTQCPDIDLSEDTLASHRGLGNSSTENAELTEGLATPATEYSISPVSITTTAPGNTSTAINNGLLAHEIGLVSLGSTQDARYIGPSSGYFLARLMLASGRRDGTLSSRREVAGVTPALIPQGLVECLQGPLPLPPLDRAKQLCHAFFDIIHPQYPILHPPALITKLEQASRGEVIDRAHTFHIFMVLAIGADLLSQRHRVRLPAESYCLSALEHLDAVNVENSVSGLQCLLLLFVFTMHCPNMKVNLWYLNYQCIASVLDLGLQRDVRVGSPGISLLDQELRTRLFWVVMMLDRRIATMMGRPIGLRDEACDLRLPQDIDDNLLSSLTASDHSMPGYMSLPIHLFKLTKLNSEFKYVANSIVRNTPRYAYPAIVDIHDWQRSFIQRLDEVEQTIPVPEHDAPYLHRVCRLRCLELKMVCLRPSPAIPTPTTASLQACYDAARRCMSLFGQLYRENLLVHSWDMFYSVTLTTITLLYCAKVVPWLTTSQTLDDDLDAGLRVLGAIGEHWIGAKRCGDILEELGRALISWHREQPSGSSSSATLRPETTGPSLSHVIHSESGTVADAGLYSDFPSLPSDFFDGLGVDGMFSDQFGLGDPMDDMDSIMRSLFDGFIPTSMNQA